MEIFVSLRKDDAWRCTEIPEKEIANEVNNKVIKLGRKLFFANIEAAFVTSIKGTRKEKNMLFLNKSESVPHITENKTTKPQTMSVLIAALLTEEEKS